MRKYFPYLIILFLLSVTAFFFIVRTEPTKFHEVTIEGKFSISVPEYLSKTDSIDASALLQFKNEKKKMFLVVYEEQDTLAQSLQELFKKFSTDIIANIENGILIKYFPEKINGKDAFTGNIKGEMNGAKAYYRISVIESSSTFYEIIIGVSDNNRNLVEEDMDRIIMSFKVRT